MGRKPKISYESGPDTDNPEAASFAIIKTRIPIEFWNVLEALGTRYGISTAAMLRVSMDRIRTATLIGALDLFGHDFCEEAKKLHRSGLAQIASPDLGIDLDKLHREERTKSGFYGVYVNGKGFRCVGADPKDPRSTIHLGTYESAEAAAWIRYQHHKKHNLPYGEWEIELKAERARNVLNDDETITELVVQVRDLGNKPMPQGLDPEIVEKMRKRIRDTYEGFARDTRERHRLENQRSTDMALGRIPRPPSEVKQFRPGLDYVPSRNTPANWVPPAGWQPPAGWVPDPSWDWKLPAGFKGSLIDEQGRDHSKRVNMDTYEDCDKPPEPED